MATESTENTDPRHPSQDCVFPPHPRIGIASKEKLGMGGEHQSRVEWGFRGFREFRGNHYTGTRYDVGALSKLQRYQRIDGGGPPGR